MCSSDWSNRIILKLRFGIRLKGVQEILNYEIVIIVLSHLLWTINEQRTIITNFNLDIEKQKEYLLENIVLLWFFLNLIPNLIGILDDWQTLLL